jgi:hypothetical protein
MTALLAYYRLDFLLDQTPHKCCQDAEVTTKADDCVALDDDMSELQHLQVANSTAKRNPAERTWWHIDARPDSEDMYGVVHSLARLVRTLLGTSVTDTWAFFNGDANDGLLDMICCLLA